jgi:hypothetical protein
VNAGNSIFNPTVWLIPAVMQKIGLVRRLGRRNSAYIAVLLLVACASSSPARAQADSPESDFKIWYERAIFGDVKVQDALTTDEPLKIHKWHTALKVLANFRSGVPEQAAELSEHLETYLQDFIDSTKITAAIVEEGSSSVRPNVLIAVGESRAASLERYGDQITEMWADGGKKVAYLEKLPPDLNCVFTLKTRDKTEITRAVIFAPMAEDVFVTQKCIAKSLFTAFGLLGENPTGATVFKRTDAAIFLTDADQLALKVHYLGDVENGVRPSEVISAIGGAQDQGILK